jgi:hypothetical protein
MTLDWVPYDYFAAAAVAATLVGSRTTAATAARTSIYSGV